MRAAPVPNDYEVLVAYGHSPAKALEIILDAKRGDNWCIGWINVARKALGKPAFERGERS